jgi:hypothetical protein
MIGNTQEVQSLKRRLKELTGWDVERLQAQVIEMQSHPLHEIGPDGKITGVNCAGCARLRGELADALAKVNALSSETRITK